MDDVGVRGKEIMKEGRNAKNKRNDVGVRGKERMKEGRNESRKEGKNERKKEGQKEGGVAVGGTLHPAFQRCVSPVIKILRVKTFLFLGELQSIKKHLEDSSVTVWCSSLLK
ncbi:hypothetical protein E2C01_049123 [Portunus trituberculatus]|uniref:Uncharacterized protein n=1 Tax=Portunus trituberculatus TaxID=210409 RepID=A0A5B7G8C9_PORTR|nr:hypothetical protein [Portunus trituberculatus]